MLRGLTQAGTGPFSSIEQFISLAAEYGFHAIDVDARSLIQAKGLEGAKEFLQEKNIVLGSIGLPVQWRQDENAFKDSLPQLVESAAAAAALGCTRCCTYILPSTDYKPAHFMALATRRIAVCASILDAYGIKLGLEFVGPHHLRTQWKYPFIWTMEETLDWIDAIGAPNIGLLLDAYHWHTNEMTVQDLLNLSADQIIHVHINDAPDVPVSEALDNGRVYPGEGIIDLAGFLQALHQIHYDGIVSQEVLTTAKTDSTPEERMARSKAGFDRVFKEAGLM